MDRSSNAKGWVLVIGIIVILMLSAAAVVLIFLQGLRQTQRAFQPVNDLTSNMATQMAEVLNPTPTILPDPVTIIHGIRSLARLETIQYSVEKVITAETGQNTFGFLFGDRLIFVAHGVVIAGIDMGKLGPEDLRVENNVLYVDLPEAEVFVATLNNEKSYVYDRETGALTHGDVNLETTARQAAEAEILNAALEDNILLQAQQNGENYLERLFLELGYPEVIFIDPAPQPTLTP